MEGRSENEETRQTVLSDGEQRHIFRPDRLWEMRSSREKVMDMSFKYVDNGLDL